jgi:ADP-ribose pyrophosphatase YjhB (NUDIX family)
MPTHSHGQDWLVSWWPAHDQPAGTPHGAAGVCVTATGELVLISHDGVHWGFPAGRPEADETTKDTLRREVAEEACAIVISARLLGFAHSECVDGHQKGQTLVRSYWRADVRAEPWQPQFEIRHRRLVAASAARDHVRDPDEAATRISFRALDEAGLPR